MFLLRSSGRAVVAAAFLSLVVGGLDDASAGSRANPQVGTSRVRYLKTRSARGSARVHRERPSNRLRQQSRRTARTEKLPKPPPLIPVPPVRQPHLYDCGPSSLHSVLAYYGKGGDISVPQLSKKTKARFDTGAQESEMARVARNYGLKVRMKHNMSLSELKSYVSRGIPVIIGYQAWAPKGTQWSSYLGGGHYSVVIGMDKENVWLMDPSSDLGKRGYIPIKEFKQRWHWEMESGKVGQHFGMALMSKDPPAIQVHANGVIRVE